MTTQNTDRAPNRRMLLLAILGGAGLLVIAVLVVFLLAIVSKSTSSASSAPVPYDVNTRGTPLTTNIRDLLPQTLGNFTRKTVKGDLSTAQLSGQFSATYTTDNKDTITISGFRETHDDQAQADLDTLISKINSANKELSQDRKFGYVLATFNNGSVRFSYARSYWLFDITASSRAALDAFMKVFKY